jgi:hypothetical protein
MSHRFRAAAALILPLLSMVSTAESQLVQAGVSGTIGTAGIGLDLDLSAKRAGVFIRGQVSPSAQSRIAGLRGYVFGARSSGFYISAVAGQLSCSSVDLGGVATSCDDEWHGVWGVFGGVEIGTPESQWSVWIDGGPFWGARNVAGLRDWTAATGVRIRAPKQ